MLRLIHNKKIPTYFLTLAGLVIVAFFSLNTYPVGHWFGVQFLTFPGGPEILGIVSAAFIVIYQVKCTVSQKTCHAAKRFQRIGFLTSSGVASSLVLFSHSTTFLREVLQHPCHNI